nr:MAG TPA: hypothetical protein [Caudoviricetes sp.]
MSVSGTPRGYWWRAPPCCCFVNRVYVLTAFIH